jgi:hypothetical protein
VELGNPIVTFTPRLRIKWQPKKMAGVKMAVEKKWQWKKWQFSKGRKKWQYFKN